MRVLLYHRVRPDSEPAAPFSVSASALELQMRALESRGWHGGSIAQTLARSADDPDERRFALTFDDGYEDFARVALPVLERIGVTATVFVVTGFVGGRADWGGGSGAPLLGWPSIRDLHDRGIEFGSHTRTHPHLIDLPRDRVLEELRSSRQELEDRLGPAVRWLAYPYGESDPAVRRLARDAGYEDAFGVLPSRSGLFDRRRLECGDHDGPFGIRLKLSRWYPWYSRLASKSHRTRR